MDAQRARVVADRQIRRLGGRVGAIRRGPTGSTTDTRIMVAVSQDVPREARGELYAPGDKYLVISTFNPSGGNLTTEPDPETDAIVLYRVPVGGSPVDDGDPYRLVMPPKRIEAHGILISLECLVRR